MSKFGVGTRVRKINQGWEGRVIAVMSCKPIDPNSDLVPVQWDTKIFEMVPACILEEIKCI